MGSERSRMEFWDSDIQHSPSVSMCQLYISIYTYVLVKVSGVLRHLTDFQGRNYESMKRHLEIICTTSWEGKNGWLKMERRSSNRFVSCLVVVCLVCLHWFCFMFCVACPRKEGFESLGCPFSPLSSHPQNETRQIFQESLFWIFIPETWVSAGHKGMEKTRTLATNSWEYTPDLAMMFGFLDVWFLTTNMTLFWFHTLES